MLPSGTMICPVCGQIFHEIYYSASDSSGGVLLKKSSGLLDGGHYYVEPYSPDGRIPERPFQLETTQEQIRQAAGMPDTLELKEGGEYVKFSRYCPKCKNRRTPLHHGWGRVPTFVIPVVGNTSAGKSSLLHAMATTNNISALGRAGYPFTLNPSQITTITAAQEVTTIDSTGNTQVLALQAFVDGKKMTLCHILFRDVAGELFNRRIEEHEAWNLLSAHGEYSGPDAFLFVQSAIAHENVAIDVYNQLRKHIESLNRSWPVTGFVLSHVDLANWTAYDDTERYELPVLDRNTFKVCTAKRPSYYKPSTLLPRMALENDLVEKHFDLYVTHTALTNSEKTRGFLIKACEPDAQDATKSNYAKPINVLDPILWVLSELRLISLTEEA